MHKWLLGILLNVSLLGLMSCGGGSAAGSSGGTGVGNSQSITGTVLAPNGTDPVAGATISIPSSSASISVKGIAKTVSATCSGTTLTCSDPASTALVSTCSCADGKFTLDVSSLTSTQKSAATTMKIEKGSLTKTVSLSCSGTSCAIAATDSTLPASGTGALKMAVVTGQYDSIQDVLAKLGFGELDSNTNKLKVGTEKFTLFRGGDSSLDSTLSSTSTTTYPTSRTLFNDLTLMKTFNIIFINCGAELITSLSASESVKTLSKGLSHEAYHQMLHKALGGKSTSGTLTLDATLVSNLKAYVNAGGRLYVTDLSFDYIEQPFPEAMDFEGNTANDSATPETNDSEVDVGISGITSDATVNNSTMSSWLSGRASNTIASGTPGNSCTTTANGNATALNSDGTIRIGDFLSGWAVMNKAYDSTTTIWIQGPVTFGSTTTATTRPLTISRPIGSSGGKVLYSSYHTAHSCPTSGFWPQERVLQYLVFEVAQ